MSDLPTTASSECVAKAPRRRSVLKSWTALFSVLTVLWTAVGAWAEPRDLFLQARSFPELFRDMELAFDTNSLAMKERFDRVGAQTARALFYTEQIANFWQIPRLGCALMSEATGFRHVKDRDVTLAAYQRSEVACCTDFALFLKLLLDYAGIENRVLTPEGHWTNEALLDGQWWMLDAMAGVAILGTRDKPAGSAVLTLHRTHDTPAGEAFRKQFLHLTLGGTWPAEWSFEGSEFFDVLSYGRLVERAAFPKEP